MMKELRLLTLTICVFFCGESKAQQKFTGPVETTMFSLTPANKHIVVNGLALGLWAHPSPDAGITDTLFTSINGLNLEVGPMGIVGALWGMLIGFGGFDYEGKDISFFSSSNYDTLYKDQSRYGTHVKGLSISIFGISETFNTGVFVNGLSGYCHSIKGIQVSGLINSCIDLRGISIALLDNVATKAEGVQIGLINKCKTGNVVQIGLFNRIGRRVIPFMNFRFKRDKPR